MVYKIYKFGRLDVIRGFTVPVDIINIPLNCKFEYIMLLVKLSLKSKAVVRVGQGSVLAFFAQFCTSVINVIMVRKLFK